MGMLADHPGHTQMIVQVHIYTDVQIYGWPIGQMLYVRWLKKFSRATVTGFKPLCMARYVEDACLICMPAWTYTVPHLHPLLPRTHSLSWTHRSNKSYWKEVTCSWQILSLQACSFLVLTLFGYTLKRMEMNIHTCDGCSQCSNLSATVPQHQSSKCHSFSAFCCRPFLCFVNRCWERSKLM